MAGFPCPPMSRRRRPDHRCSRRSCGARSSDSTGCEPRSAFVVDGRESGRRAPAAFPRRNGLASEPRSTPAASRWSAGPPHGHQSLQRDRERPGPRVRLRGRRRRHHAAIYDPNWPGRDDITVVVVTAGPPSADRRKPCGGCSGSPDVDPYGRVVSPQGRSARSPEGRNCRPASLRMLGQRLLDRERRTEGALVAHRVKGIDESDDRAPIVIALPAQLVGIPESVPALVMVSNDRREDGASSGRTGEVLADLRDVVAFLSGRARHSGQWTRLGQDRLGDAEVARCRGRALRTRHPWARRRRDRVLSAS